MFTGLPNHFPLLTMIFPCRPVKVIRLVARSTVEEIVLKRADDKLKLTNTVIEGGKVLDSFASSG